MARQKQKLGITAVFVTHDQEEALSVSDRTYVMRNGHIKHCGTPAEIYQTQENYAHGNACDVVDQVVLQLPPILGYFGKKQRHVPMTLFTLIIQSSGATTGITIAMLSRGQFLLNRLFLSTSVQRWELVLQLFWEA